MLAFFQNVFLADKESPGGVDQQFTKELCIFDKILMQSSTRFDWKHNQIHESCHEDTHNDHDQDLDDPVIRELASLDRAFLHEDGNTSQRSQRARNVDKGVTKMLLRPGDEAHSSSNKHNQHDRVPDLEQIPLAKEHRHSHASEGDEGSVAETNKSKDDRFVHRADGSGRAEIDCDCAHDMLRVCFADQR